MGAIGTASQTIRTVVCIQPQAIKNNAEWVGSTGSTPVTVDTAASGVKYNSARVMFALGATDVTIAGMNVMESDDDLTYAEIPGLDFTTDGTAPSATDDNKTFAAFVDLRDKKRYMQLYAVAGNGTSGSYLCAWVDLFDATETPANTADRNNSQELFA